MFLDFFRLNFFKLTSILANQGSVNRNSPSLKVVRAGKLVLITVIWGITVSGEYSALVIEVIHPFHLKFPGVVVDF